MKYFLSKKFKFKKILFKKSRSKGVKLSIIRYVIDICIVGKENVQNVQCKSWYFSNFMHYSEFARKKFLKTYQNMFELVKQKFVFSVIIDTISCNENKT